MNKDRPKNSADYLFVSYSRADHKFAKRLVTSLEGAGVPFWIDEQSMVAGDSLISRIQYAIMAARYFIVLLSQESVDSSWVQEELKLALTRQFKEKDRFVVPVVIDDCEIPPFLQDRLYIDFRNRRKYKESFSKLLHAIDGLSISVLAEDSDAQASSDMIAGVQSILDDDPEAAEAMEHNPIALLAKRAAEYGSFSGLFSSQFRSALTFTSNHQSTFMFSLVALIAFTGDSSSAFLERRDVQQLWRSAAEERAISTDFRWFICSRLAKLYPKIALRQDRLEALPAIFSGKFDRLANKIIDDFFSDESNILQNLWESGSTEYRRSILNYINRVGDFKYDLRVDEDVLLRNNSRSALSRVFVTWQGIRVPETSYVPDEILNDLVEKKISIDHAVYLIERLCSLEEKSITLQFHKIADKEFCDAMIASWSNRGLLKFFVGIFTSPEIDSAIGGMVLLGLAIRFGPTPLMYYEGVQESVLRVKECSVFGERQSILTDLMDGCNEDPMNPMFSMLKAIVGHLGNDYIKLAILWHTDGMDDAPKPLVEMRDGFGDLVLP